MRRMLSVAKKALKQIVRDKRTLAIILVVPLLLFSLIYFVLQGVNSDHVTYHIGTIDSSLALKDSDSISFETKEYTSLKDGKQALKQSDIDVLVQRDKNQQLLFTFRNKSKQNQQLIDLITTNLANNQKHFVMNKMNTNEKVIYPYELNLFDKYAGPLMGVMIFFLVFLTSGIKFLNERLSGTLDRILMTPIRKLELILGYNLGFAILAIVQTVLITLFCQSILGIHIEGDIVSVMIVNILTALCAVSLAMLLSSMANSQFEFVQFIPLVIIPQIFLCGIFDLNNFFDMCSYLTPLHYSSDALNKLILDGVSLGATTPLLLALCGFIIFNIVINLLVMRKYRCKA